MKRERGIVCMARHHLLRLVHVSIMSSYKPLQSLCWAQQNSTKVGYRFQPNNYGDVGGMHHTSSLTSTTKPPQGVWNFKLVSAYIFTNRSPLIAQYWSNLKDLHVQLGLLISFLKAEGGEWPHYLFFEETWMLRVQVVAAAREPYRYLLLGAVFHMVA